MTVYQNYHFKILAASMPRGWTAIRLCGDGLLCKTQTGSLMVWQGFNAVNTPLRRLRNISAKKCRSL